MGVVLSVAGMTVFFAYMSLNSRLVNGLKLFMFFLSVFGMIILINQARLIVEGAVTNPDLILLLSVAQQVLVWFFFLISAILLVLQIKVWFKNGKIGSDESSERTR